jgi:DNA-binding MurR/RpiR family transcriptional regulator
MNRHLEVQNRIRKNYGKLPHNQKKIADFFVDSLDLVPFVSVQEVAKATASSVASVIRFTQRIGYDGYSQMRDHVGIALQKHLKNEALFPLSQTKALKKDTLTSVAMQDVGNINQTLELIQYDEFHRVTDVLLHAERVFTAGLGMSFLMAQILAYQLNQIGIDATPLRHGSASYAEQCLYFKKKDLLVVFSFPPYSKETIELAKLCRKRSIRVAAITNKSTAPITFYANHSLIVKSENMLFMNSFAAIAVVINAISTECTLKNKTKAERMLHDLNVITKDQQETL